MSEANRPGGYVIDASVAIKLFIEDPLSERAYDVFGLLASGRPVDFYVPDLFFIECANVLWKYIRWGGLSLEAALENLSDLAQVGLSITSTADLMIASLEIAQRFSISAYDACYVALAEQYRAPLITADQKLAQTLPRVVWLGDF